MTRKDMMLAALSEQSGTHLSTDHLLNLPESQFSARFVTFDVENARDLQATFEGQKLITDCRGVRLRLGFSIYQSEVDVGRLITFL